MDSPPNTIIVAEDETLVRMLAADTLATAGFSVIEATNADEAITALQDNDKAVAVLFTDIHMPGELSGLELARLVRERWPRVAILVTSSLTKPGAAEMPLDSVFMAKPYRAERMVAHVHTLIGSQARQG